MEDASKEFQIFLSPMRDYQQPYREESTTKHRVVPVINKVVSCSSSSSSSTFTLSQRKCSVYKAVSGVSFQDTDEMEKKPVSKREKRDKKRERRQSYAPPIYDSENKHRVPPLAPGTRRSKSLTSMESALTVSGETNKNLPEITHPFTPVIIYNQSSGRKSRYSRVKDRKRSASQVRNGAELKRHDTSHKTDQEPIRPRRSRSASRSRHPLPLSLMSDDSSVYSSLTKDSSQVSSEKQVYRKVNNIERMPNIAKQCQEISSHLGSHKSYKEEEIDFSVNDSDWRKYHEIVTEKLDSLLKKKEEPEGGYFSLEREEAEELENLTDSGDQFERENSSESIYIAQALTKEEKVSDIQTKYDQYTIEEVYSEVPFSNRGQEVGFVDDEGLYEEIFFDKSSDMIPTVFSNTGYGETKPISIKVIPEVEDHSNIQSMPKLFKEIKFPKIEKSSSSTIVYISSEDQSCSKSPPLPLKHSASCTNLIPKYNDHVTSKDKRLSFIDIRERPRFMKEDHRESQSVWCGCHVGPDSQFSHSASCIKSRSGILSGKCAFTDAQKIEDNRHSDTFTKSNEFSSPLSKDQNTLSQETDYELSDIDLDMFAPKTVSEERLYLRNRENMIRSSSEAHLNHQPFNHNLFFTYSKSTKDNSPESKDIISPKTFRGFLEDSIFNPPDSESLSDDNEDLIIKENQIVTCISDSDSSSSSSSDEDENENSEVVSPWLEAKNEFEFVTFQKKDPKAPIRSNKKKKRKNLISIPKLFSSSFLQENSRLNKSSPRYSQESSQETPERPSRRRRKTSEPSKLGEIN